MDDLYKRIPDSAEKVIDVLRFCPECGKKLEINPLSSRPACFLHGDFHLRDDEIVWVFTKYLIKRP